MIINIIDLGAPSHPWTLPVAGQEIGSVFIEGSEWNVYPRGSIVRKQMVTFQAKGWQGMGGAAAGSQQATKYLIKQLEELANNHDSQPAYIQWNATADPAASLNAVEAHDGWYVIDSFEPDYSNFIISGIVACRMTVTHIAAPPPRAVAMSYTGGALTTNFSGAAVNIIALPIGATAVETTVTRVGAEGTIPSLSPIASPEPTVLSATIANTFKGGCHVYDTINTGTNPVPTSGGTFVNANWIEVFYSDHDFLGDCVVTNGLQLLLFQAGGGQTCTCYLWNTALATANWQQYATFGYDDNSLAGMATLRTYSLLHIGPEEVAIVTTSSNTAAAAQVTLRVQRGRYEVRADLRSLTQATSNNFSLLLSITAAKIAYNSSHVADMALAESSPAVPTDYGYGAAFTASTVNPYILGFLYQNQPGTSQPALSGTVNLGLGDAASLAINAQRSYGFFAVPYGVNASYSTANLQAEAESGALGTGWTNAADAAASGGHTANLASGTLSTNADLWGTSFVPAPGVYDLWVRMKTTVATSATAQLQIGLWDATSSAFVTSTTYAPNQTTTGYQWYRVAASVTPTATHNMQVRAVTTATTTDAWQIDESALVPHTLSAANTGPQEQWQHFTYDRSTRLVRP